MKARKWAVDLVKWALKAMGLERWDVEVSLETGMARVADACIQPEYEVALLRISAETHDNRVGQIAVLHEVIHLQHAPLYTSWEYVLAMLPEDKRELGKKILEEADELVVQREAAAWQEQHIQCSGGCTNTASCGIIRKVDVDQASPAEHEEEH